MAPGNKADIQLIMELIDRTKDKIQKKLQRIGGYSKITQKSIKGLNKEFSALEMQQKTLNKAMGKVQLQFAGWAMSIMFFGMALKRVFDSIWKNSTKVFQEVMHSVDGTTTGFDILQGSIAYLGFTVGQALEPIAEFLVPIIEAVANWVQENPKIAAGLLIVVGVMGTLLMWLGMAKLALDGLVMMFSIFGAHAGGVITFIGSLFSVTMLGFWVVVLAFVAMWMTNFGGIRDFVKSTFAVIWETIKSVFKNIKGIFSGIITFIKGIFTGDFDMAMRGLIQVVWNVVGMILKLFIGLGSALFNVLLFVINLLKDLFFGLFTFILGMIRAVIRGINRIPGINIPTSWLDKSIDKLNEWKEAATIDYMSVEDIKGAMAGVDGLTDTVIGMANDYFSNKDSTETPTTKVDVYVELDGEQVAKSTSEKIFYDINRTD